MVDIAKAEIRAFWHTIGTLRPGTVPTFVTGLTQMRAAILRDNEKTEWCGQTVGSLRSACARASCHELGAPILPRAVPIATSVGSSGRRPLMSPVERHLLRGSNRRHRKGGGASHPQGRRSTSCAGRGKYVADIRIRGLQGRRLRAQPWRCPDQGSSAGALSRCVFTPRS